MLTDPVVMGLITPCGDHTHLEWVCPDCGTSGCVGGDESPLRIKCGRSGRHLLIVGIPESSWMRVFSADSAESRLP
jgi:hypothetical protein